MEREREKEERIMEKEEMWERIKRMEEAINEKKGEGNREIEQERRGGEKSREVTEKQGNKEKEKQQEKGWIKRISAGPGNRGGQRRGWSGGEAGGHSKNGVGSLAGIVQSQSKGKD
ncbi:hypothetical protein PV325_007461 [Microctonus aethiopoides]|nr:hypothetical protein PV325_007461 [Microctonus aethiopoides]